MADGLLSAVIDAHGGQSRWQAVSTIHASLSSGGLAFASHFQPSALKHLRVSMQPHARTVRFTDFCHPGWTGVWTPERVEIHDAAGRLQAERQHPRSDFSRLGKQFRWDKLDILYFGGYAVWNYLSFPFLLTLPEVTVEASVDASSGQRVLEASFAPDFPTHSARQRFFLDNALQLTRHDYTADVIGRWANAANLCLASASVDGLRFYTRRKVYPRMGNVRVMPFPTLVWIEIDDLQVERGTA